MQRRIRFLTRGLVFSLKLTRLQLNRIKLLWDWKHFNDMFSTSASFVLVIAELSKRFYSYVLSSISTSKSWCYLIRGTSLTSSPIEQEVHLSHFYHPFLSFIFYKISSNQALIDFISNTNPSTEIPEHSTFQILDRYLIIFDRLSRLKSRMTLNPL